MDELRSRGSAGRIAPRVLRRMPTHCGDVLILLTTQNVPTYAIATVSTDGQQDFGRGVNIMHLASFTEAVNVAKTHVLPGSRTYLMNIDTGEWAWVSSEKGWER
jgi:hypothetical protein